MKLGPALVLLCSCATSPPEISQESAALYRDGEVALENLKNARFAEEVCTQESLDHYLAGLVTIFREADAIFRQVAESNTGLSPAAQVRRGDLYACYAAKFRRLPVPEHLEIKQRQTGLAFPDAYQERNETYASSLNRAARVLWSRVVDRYPEGVSVMKANARLHSDWRCPLADQDRRPAAR
jgi:hypothetical protein